MFGRCMCCVAEKEKLQYTLNCFLTTGLEKKIYPVTQINLSLNWASDNHAKTLQKHCNFNKISRITQPGHNKYE